MVERQPRPACAIGYLKDVSTPRLIEWFEFKKSEMYEAMVNEIKVQQRRMIEEVFSLPPGKIEPKVLMNKGRIKGLAFIEDFLNDVERELQFRNKRDVVG